MLTNSGVTIGQVKEAQKFSMTQGRAKSNGLATAIEAMKLTNKARRQCTVNMSKQRVFGVHNSRGHVFDCDRLAFVFAADCEAPGHDEVG